MKKTFKATLLGLLAVPVMALGLVALPTQSAFAANCTGIECISEGTSAAGNNDSCLFTGIDGCTDGIFTIIINTALYIIGALSVLMLIYGGIRYTLSGGDSKSVESAKNTIMYAIIGVVVALLAFAIVNFVLGTLIK